MTLTWRTAAGLLAGGPRRVAIGRWLPIVDAYRTLVVCPPPAVRAVFQQFQELALA